MKKIIKYVTLSIIISFITILSAYWGHIDKFVCTSSIYFFFTWFVLYKNTGWPRKLLLSIIIIIGPVLLIQSPIYIISFSRTTGSLLSFMAYFWGLTLGIIAYYSNRFIKVALFLLLIFINIWIAVVGYSYWINYINYGTFDGKTEMEIPEFAFRTEDGKVVTNNTIRGKIVVLDFWTTSCGVCFRKFPILEKKYLQYSGNPNVKFFAVNAAIKEDTIGQALVAIRSRNYTFAVLFTTIEKAKNDFKVFSYPTVIIFGVENKIIYKGDIENIDNVIENELKERFYNSQN